MRISDWSSDVCSSDLIAFIGGRVVIRADRAGGAEHNEDRWRQPGEGTSPEGHGREAFKSEILDARGRQFGCGNHEHSSEEHTSELQSLMRISYAVLCLQKQR